MRINDTRHIAIVHYLKFSFDFNYRFIELPFSIDQCLLKLYSYLLIIRFSFCDLWLYTCLHPSFACRWHQISRDWSKNSFWLIFVPQWTDFPVRIEELIPKQIDIDSNLLFCIPCFPFFLFQFVFFELWRFGIKLWFPYCWLDSLPIILYFRSLSYTFISQVVWALRMLAMRIYRSVRMLSRHHCDILIQAIRK